MDWISEKEVQMKDKKVDSMINSIETSSSYRDQSIHAIENCIYHSEGTPYDIIVDGANVGYYKQNYAGAPTHIDYFQVDAMVKYLQKTGRRTLLVLHCRHLRQNVVPNECIDIAEELKRSGDILIAPQCSNDGKYFQCDDIVTPSSLLF